MTWYSFQTLFHSVLFTHTLPVVSALKGPPEQESFTSEEQALSNMSGAELHQRGSSGSIEAHSCAEPVGQAVTSLSSPYHSGCTWQPQILQTELLKLEITLKTMHNYAQGYFTWAVTWMHAFQAYRGTEMEQVLWKKGPLILNKSTKYFTTSFALSHH